MSRIRVRQSPGGCVAVLGSQITGACAGMLAEHLARLRKLSSHPNRLLHYDQLLAAHLLAFYDPAVRSLRTFDAQSVASVQARETLGGLRLARSTVSDAMNQLPAEALLPLMRELLQRLPNHCSNPQAADLLMLKKRILAIDGSYFRVPADVLWALAHRRSNDKLARQVRLDLHLDVLQFLPVKAQVDGADRGSESAAFASTLQAGVVYLADRNFLDFDFLRAALDAGSDFVVRLKNNPASLNTVVHRDLALSEADKQAGVVSDQIVTLPGSAGSPGLAQRKLRIVTVFDPVARQNVRLLTTLLDVPAELIGRLYRHRWVIELFFRWLKCLARIKHLYSESSNGMTMQFYVVIIATLLMHLYTGQRPSLYTLQIMGLAVRGDLVLEKVPEVLERIARERELERLRRLKNKSK